MKYTNNTSGPSALRGNSIPRNGSNHPGVRQVMIDVGERNRVYTESVMSAIVPRHLIPKQLITNYIRLYNMQTAINRGRIFKFN